MSIDITITVLLVASVLLSLFLALVFLTSQNEKKRGAKALGLAMMVLGVFLFDFSWLNGSLGFEGNLVVSVPFLSLALSLLPLLFLYVLRLTGVKKLTRRYFLHFLPSIVCLLIYIIFLFFLSDEAINEIKAGQIFAPYSEIFPPAFRLFMIVFNDGIFILQILGYVVAFLIVLKEHYKRITNYYSNLEGYNLSWYKGFIIIYLMFLSSILATEYLLAVSVSVSNLIYTIEILVFLVFMGYFGLRQQDVVLLPQESKLPYMDESKMTVLAEHLKKVMENDKPFLDSHFTINTLSNLLKSNRMYVSALLNDHLGQSFYPMINGYRIDEAVKILEDTESMKYSIEGIAHSVGYKSKSTFIKHFRAKTGQTPGQYRTQ